MIQNIEEFRAKLNPSAPGNLANREILENRKVQVNEAGPVRGLRPALPNRVTGIGEGEALRLDEVDGIGGVHWRAAAGSRSIGYGLRHISNVKRDLP